MKTIHPQSETIKALTDISSKMDSNLKSIRDYMGLLEDVVQRHYRLASAISSSIETAKEIDECGLTASLFEDYNKSIISIAVRCGNPNRDEDGEDIGGAIEGLIWGIQQTEADIESLINNLDSNGFPAKKVDNTQSSENNG